MLCRSGDFELSLVLARCLPPPPLCVQCFLPGGQRSPRPCSTAGKAQAAQLPELCQKQCSWLSGQGQGFGRFVLLLVTSLDSSGSLSSAQTAWPCFSALRGLLVQHCYIPTEQVIYSFSSSNSFCARLSLP